MTELPLRRESDGGAKQKRIDLYQPCVDSKK